MNKVCNYKSILSVCGLGLALGIVWSVLTILMTFFDIPFALPNNMMQVFKTTQVNADISILSVIVCTAWSFLHGFIFGVAIALLYNFIIKHCPCKCCSNPVCCIKTKCDKNKCNTDKEIKCEEKNH